MRWILFFLFLFLIPSHAFIIPNSFKVKMIRKSIDVIDDSIHDLIQARLECAKQLKGRKPSIRDPVREVSIIARLRSKGALDPIMIQNIWKTLFQESYRVQKSEEDFEE